MANKNAPLKRPVGTDGGGNIRVPGAPMVLDLDDFDDLFGAMDQDSPKQGPLGQFYSGLKESFNDRFKTKNIVRNFLRSAAPDGISNVMGFADEAMNASRDIKDSLESTNAGDLQYIAKKAQGLLPKVKDYLSEDSYNKISQGLENKIDEYDYTVQSKRDQTAIRRQAAENDSESQIKQALDNIALTERLNHNRSEGSANKRFLHERAENSIRDVLQTKRFDFVAKSMGMAVDNLQKITGYNEQVNYGFQRKGLELQFRSYLGIKELVKLQEAQIELNTRAFNSIIRNTAVPDHEKSNNKSLMSMSNGSNNKFTSKVVRSIGGKTLSNFLGDYGNESQSRVSNSLSQKLSMAVSAMKMGEGGPSLWDNKYSMAGNVAGDFLSDFLVNDIIPMMGREARPHLTKLSNKHGGRHNQAGYLMDNVPAFLQEFVNNGQNHHGLKGGIRDLIAPYVPQFGLQDRLQNGTFQTIDQHATFNQATQRTIVDVIPGYLSRILQEIRMTRTGEDSVNREVFDMTTGKFTVETNAYDNLQNKIIPKSSVRSASSTINDALNLMDDDGTLTPQARKALGERMLRDASTNKRFDPNEYIKSRGYAGGTDPSVTQELDNFFRGKFEYDEKGKMTDSSDNHKLRQEFSQAFLDIRSISRDPVKEINRLIGSGNTEPLRAMGIIITEDNHDRINYPRIWEILRSGVTDNNPYSPNGDGHDPFRDDNSGTKGHKDFMGPVNPGMAQAFAKTKLNRFRKRHSFKEMNLRDGLDQLNDSVNARFGSAIKTTQDTFADVKGNTDFANNLVTAKESTKGYMVAGMSKLTDLYSTFDPTQPIIKGIDFGLGDLIDVNTKKIITSPKDITGEVINKLGQTVVTETEAATGLISPKGEIVVKVPTPPTDALNRALALHKNSNAIDSNVETNKKDPNSPEELNNQDWALGPGEKPIITARGLANDEYVDDKGNLLSSIADIASDVYDRSGNLVLTAKDFANGLWSKRTGTRYRPTKGFSKVLSYINAASKFSSKSATSIAGGALKFGAKAALGIASRAFNFVVDNQNAYLPGENVPVLTRRALKNGEYYDEDGKVVEDFVDVYSPLQSAQGEPIISPELYKQLKNFDGTKHILAKNQRIWSKAVMRPLRAVRKAYARQTKKYYNWLGKKALKIGGWLGRKTLGGFAKAGDKLFNSMLDKVEDPNTKATIEATIATGQQQTSVLEELLTAVQDLKPKKIRKGSWQDKAASSIFGDNTKVDPDSDTDEKKDSLFKRGLAGLAGLLGFGKKKDDDDEGGFGLSEAADVAELGSAGKGLFSRAKRWGGRVIKGIGKSKIGRLGTAAATAVGTSAVGKVGLGIAARGALMAATGISALLSAPAVAIAAAGTGVYLGVKRYNEISGEFRELRFEQYGVGEPVKMKMMDRVFKANMFSLGGDKKKILAMEALLEKHTDRNSPNPILNIKAVGARELLEVMGIDVKDKAEILNFSQWLEKRFKPIYLKWITGLFKLGKSDISINDVDSKLPDVLKADFLETIKFPYSGDTPYASLDNPFSSEYPLKDNISTIEKMFEELIKKYADKADKKEDKTTKGVSKVEAAAAAATAAGLSAEPIGIKPIEGDKYTGEWMKTPLGVKAAVASGSLSSAIAITKDRLPAILTPLQAIRLRAYGLQMLATADVRVLFTLESEYFKDLSYKDGVVEYKGEESKLLIKAGSLLGMDLTVGKDRPKLLKWLNDRFYPTYNAYYGTAYGFIPGTALNQMGIKLKDSERVIVAQAMLGATNSNDRSIWDCESIFEIKGGLNSLKQSADLDLQVLREKAGKDVLASPTQKGSDQMAGKTAAGAGGSFVDKISRTIKDTWESTKETVSGAWNRASDAVGNTVAGAKIAVGMGPEYGEGGPTGGSVQSVGTSGEITKGNGGQWESIPFPTASGTIKGAYPTLKAVAEMTGVPVDWLLVIAGIESGFRYSVKASTSSATGWYQFINSTWDWVYKKYGPQFGCPPDPNKSRNERNDPRINALMGAMFIKQNYDGLKKALGRSNITDVDVYMAHFLGLGGAIKFFNADPNAMAYKVFKKEYSANMPLFFVNSKPSQPRTINELYQLFRKKLETFWATVGKGYKTGGGEETEIAETKPETPGEQEKVAEEQAKASQMGAAKQKQEDEFHSWLTEEDPVADSSGKPEKVTKSEDGNKIQAMARNTTPMPGAPASGGGSSKSVNVTGTDSGASIVASNQQAQLDVAQSQNNRRSAELKRDQQVANTVNDIQTRQLNTLFEIRDLIRLQVDNSTDMLSKFGKSETTGGQGSGNNMNQSTMRNRSASNRASDLTLR